MLVGLVVLCAGAAQTSPGHSVLAGLGLSQTPPAYTELAFTDAGSLPRSVSARQAPVTVSFTIHNVSTASRDYRWSIVAVHRSAREGSDSGHVTVAAGERVTVAESLQLTCPAGAAQRDQVVVRLASPAESVNFWVACPAASPAKKPAAKSAGKSGGKRRPG